MNVIASICSGFVCGAKQSPLNEIASPFPLPSQLLAMTLKL